MLVGIYLFCFVRLIPSVAETACYSAGLGANAEGGNIRSV